MTAQLGRNPAHRLLALARRHKLSMLLATIFGTCLAATAGLMSPDIFRSEAVVEITDDSKPTTIFDLSDNTAIKLNKAKLLILSPRVLEGVAKTLMERSDLDLDAAFPGRYRIYDVKPRLALLEERLLGRKRPSASIKIRLQGEEAITTLISYHLLVNVEADAGSIRVRYEAADPTIAQEICRLIVDRFVQIMGEKDQSEVKAKVFYLQQTIDDQDRQMRVVAAQRQKLLELNPELGANGTSNMVQQYFLKKSELERARIEHDVDEKLLESYRELRDKRDHIGDALSKELKKRLMEELSASELQLTELTKLSGYKPTHDELVRLRKRNATLRLMLDDSEKKDKRRGPAPPIDFESLGTEIQRLTQVVKRSEAQAKLLQDELDRMDASRKSSIRVEFELETLNRTLDTHETLVKELQTDLEKARITMAGMAKTTLVTTPPSLPVIPNSLSLPRRVLFGVFVSLIFAISVLFGLDLLQPRILGERDFTDLGIPPLGKDDAIGRGSRRITGSLLGLCRARDEGSNQRAKQDHRRDLHPGYAVIFSAESPCATAEAFVHRIAVEMRILGRRVVVITFHEGAEVYERPCDAHTELGASFISLRFPEHGYAFVRLLERARARADFVLALVEDLHRLHDRSMILAAADVLVHVATEGATTAGSIIEARPDGSNAGRVGEAAVLLAA